MEGLSGTESQARLVVSKLVKKYGAKTAVNGLSLTLFKDEILVLLGHNGAGKTTTLSMLTGLEKPTSGKATALGVIDGQDVELFEDYGDLVDFIGICPQEDVLIDRMTVRENLEFFCRFKGVEHYDLVIDEILDEYNLHAKRDSEAGKCSGGQKRKLQLAIALLGKAKIVLLDEPSSGMDPTARREAWDIIERAKKDRIIILTTHYMDEAEMLADRLAIVSKGRLQACGTSLFLKKKYGQGFFIEVEPVNQNENENEALTNLIQQSLDNIGYEGKINVQKDD